MARQTKDEKQKNEIGFLSRWSARKEQVSKGEIVPDDEPKSAFENSDEFKLREGENLKEQDDALTDEELLEKYNLPNPEQVENEAGLDRFLNGDFPGRIRQMALRRLWHMNPLFGEVCEMVEYGEDYTDAATVIEGMQTAYQVGKGYKTKAEELEVSDSAEGNVVEGDLAEGDAVEGDVSEGDVSEGDVAEVDVAEVDVAEGDLAEGNNKDEELANKMINFMQDGAVFNDNALGASGVDAEDYILPENDVVLPPRDQREKGQTIANVTSHSAPENMPASNVLPTKVESAENASDRDTLSEVVHKNELGFKSPEPIVLPTRMNFVKPKNSD